MFAGVLRRLVVQGTTKALATTAAAEPHFARQISHSFATSSAASHATSSPAAKVTSEEAKQLDAIMQKATKSAQLTARVAALGSLAASYRDVLVLMDALHQRQVVNTNPLAAPPGGDARSPSVRAGSDEMCSTLFPVKDVTNLPDSVVPEGQTLSTAYMDKITAWTQLQPNHVETSTSLMTGINLFPAQEASYPTYIDFQAAMRLLEKHKSRKRIKLLRRLRKRQDLYQLRSWRHGGH